MEEKQNDKSILDILSFDIMMQDADEIEIGHLCLEFYEDIEKAMNELGIHIKLNVYEGADVYIRQREYVIRMCLNTLVYYSICMLPNLKILVISVEEHENRIWINFYSEGDSLKADCKKKYSIRSQNLDYTMKIVQQYMQQYNICPMAILNENVWKLGLGFEFIDRREDI